MNPKTLLIAYLACILAVVLVGSWAIGRAKTTPSRVLSNAESPTQTAD